MKLEVTPQEEATLIGALYLAAEIYGQHARDASLPDVIQRQFEMQQETALALAARAEQ